MKDNKPFNSQYDLYFEPENPITTKEEFTNEIMNYFSKENKFVSMVEESMEPQIEVDNETYICRLGEPLRTNKLFKTPINPIAGRFLGYKYVYMYKVNK